MVIQVCVGSSCHLSGSYKVIENFKSLIEKNELENKITLKASFCLGKCSKDVSIRVDSGEVLSLKPENVHNFFKDKIEKEL